MVLIVASLWTSSQAVAQQSAPVIERTTDGFQPVGFGAIGVLPPASEFTT
jgi:hypothetical protein